ncbi:MAG TPA: CmpA/NrtA family ABC transporter substrate-binding protein [Phenylobacterium sp.]|uniref:CmpA/NrtA family ABC transporter substrate-binding protein n=1 Tax=Phenylobacterium sp. TaxID=1871053 RepID=UPI002B481B28|nr:CmpA/NrtA family ABC transporter substrate-binding protein [Phenylobacterium sp.]HKR88868.1 CmpA/NrtA family ABC transporter substrate-binding protein [Phenylobacterium sp.]
MSEAGELVLGFVPLNDAAPLIVAKERGLFAAEGLQVRLSREVSWATVRDKVAAGALDGAHMLAPIPLACTLGVGGEPQPMIAAMALNRSGAAFTLSRRLTQWMAPDEDRRAGLKRLIGERRAQGEPPFVFAVVFPYSMHNYMLRYWLAEAGIDPDQDVRITVAPPSRMASRLAAGELDGFCAGEPWNAVAEDQELGEVAVRASEVWRDGPEKVFGVTAEWARRNPLLLKALLRALLQGAAWCDAAENRGELAALLARPEYVDVSADSIARSLPAIVFHRDHANAPLPVQAAWLLSQMMRWGQAPRELDLRGVAEHVYRPDLYNNAAADLGWLTVTPPETAAGFADGSEFSLDQARAYAASFPLSRLART